MLLLVNQDWQDRLFEAMSLRSITGAELARRTGFTAQYINSLKSKDRGGRLPLETAQKLAAALSVNLEWLVHGDEPREAPRLSDVYPAGTFTAATDPYPSRAEVIALLGPLIEAEVVAALRTVQPKDDKDPGRDFWIAYAKDLTKTLRKIKSDPVFQSAESSSRQRVRTQR